MIDLGTGNNNKINWTLEDKQEMIDIIETVYRGARKGRGQVVSPKDYSTKYRYYYFVIVKAVIYLWNVSAIVFYIKTRFWIILLIHDKWQLQKNCKYLPIHQK